MDIGKSHRHPTRPRYGFLAIPEELMEEENHKITKGNLVSITKKTQTRMHQYNIHRMKKNTSSVLLVGTQYILGVHF